jgi:hypothetical protein
MLWPSMSVRENTCCNNAILLFIRMPSRVKLGLSNLLFVTVVTYSSLYYPDSHVDGHPMQIHYPVTRKRIRRKFEILRREMVI